ncbi:Protein of unknown function [Bacillus toyonensis]|nr:Protein of unknown function [Bacillus toyonensis]
MGMDRSPTD